MVDGAAHDRCPRGRGRHGRGAVLALSAALAGSRRPGSAAGRCRRACSTSTRHVSTEVVDRHGVAALRGAVRCAALRSRRLDPAATCPRTLVRGDARRGGRALLPPSGGRSRWPSRAPPGTTCARGRMVEGGSTITQQTVKLLIRRPRTAARQAARDAAGAAARASAEQARDPGPLPERGALRQPARRARRRPAARTSAARRRTSPPRRPRFLAGLPAAALRARPVSAPRRGRSRRQRWCSTAWRARASCPRRSCAARARGAPAILRPRRSRLHRAALRGARCGPRASRAPRRIETTLDAELQREVRGIVRHAPRAARGARRAQRRGGRARQRAPASGWPGKARATTRTTRPRRRHRRRVSPRQPGSALKPFTYALAFERGLHAGHRAARRARAFPDRRAGRALQPAQLRRRVPRPAARAPRPGRLGERARGVDAVPGRACPTCCGCCAGPGSHTLDQTADHYGYALTMGDAEVRLDELVAAYSALARGGVWRAPRLRARGSCATAASTRAAPAAPTSRSSRRAPPSGSTDILSDPDARAWVFGAAAASTSRSRWR